uniref:Lipoprotein n=1 Tax=Mycoplasma feriruminatoris TaxID=1179777 RepID=A0A654IKI6_9MOLU|nr:hypothetical protein MF5295_00524 [Mycoplasma feriruminatoris]
MKKILTILGFLTVLSSSLVIVACKAPRTEQKVKNKEDNLNNNSSSSGNTKSNVDSKDKNISSNNNKPQEEQPPVSSMIGEKEKKINEFAEKMKLEVEEFISKREKDKIKNYAFGLIDKILKKSLGEKGQKRISELDDKILLLLSKSDLDQIKAEINLLFSEIYGANTTPLEDVKNKLTDLLSKVDKKEEDEILEIANKLLTEILQNEFNEEMKKISSEIEKLLENNNFSKLKEKIFNLIQEATELEKASIK